jgi:23S rRNA-/tRNA-specific pseudouridylate synthase
MSRAARRWTVVRVEPLGAVLDRLQARSALEEGRVFVDGVRARDDATLLAAGANVEVYAPRTGTSELRILAEQPGLVFVAKPVGMATEPERRGETSVVTRLLARALKLPFEHVHALSRLDVGVSGVVILGTTAAGRKRVTDLRAAGRLRRRYVALAEGKAELERGTWNDAIARRDSGPRRRAGARGSAATTRYWRVAEVRSGQAMSVLALEPVTGRTHQLRVHAAAHGLPLLGDKTYGGPGRVVLATGQVVALERVFLHAAWVELGDGPRVACELPIEFESVWTSAGGDCEALERAVDEPVEPR